LDGCTKVQPDKMLSVIPNAVRNLDVRWGYRSRGGRFLTPFGITSGFEDRAQADSLPQSSPTVTWIFFGVVVASNSTCTSVVSA
jgi:hypothetical protein